MKKNISCLMSLTVLLGLVAVSMAADSRPADGPQIKHVGAVAPDVLMITIQSGFYTPNEYIPYVAQPGDEIIEEGKDNPKSAAYKCPMIQDGKLVNVFNLQLKRNGKVVGNLTRDRTHLLIAKGAAGTLLDAAASAQPASYQIQSATDKAYGQPVSPTAVYRKCKPNGAAGNSLFPFIYCIALKLPAALQEDASYLITFPGLNTTMAKLEYAHKPRLTRSDAVHVSQVGYRPDDMCKRAYLSIWLGQDANGQGLDVDYPAGTMELVDAKSGKTVYSGKPVLTKKKGDLDDLGKKEQDLSFSSVQRLDFSDFKTPGEYCVYLPGIGRSAPFRIANDVWEEPFRAVMQCILMQRNGIELKAPYSQWSHPRSFREEDGSQFYQASIVFPHSSWAGARNPNAEKLFNDETGGMARVHGVWGGYQDAGDWQTGFSHLPITSHLFDLYEMFPKCFDRFKLLLPEDEARSKIPNILSEALWTLDAFKRLQLPDGGVRGGYNALDGGENVASWQSKSVVVFAADLQTSYIYACAAAKAARVLATMDPDRAAGYRQSALRAWNWAEKKRTDPQAMKEMAPRFGWKIYNADTVFIDERRQACIALCALTGDAHYLDPKILTISKDCMDSTFAYARLPEGLGDPALKKRAVELFSKWADEQVERSNNNGFDLLHMRSVMLQWGCIFSVPGEGVNLARAAFLTKKPEHVAAVVQSCNYCLGANPLNLCYISGIGWNSFQFPFKLDLKIIGQPAGVPRGFVPFGFQGFVSWWAEAWINGGYRPNGPRMFPASKNWPAEERFLDWSIDTYMTENGVQSTELPTAYTLGFLMAREPRSQND